MSPGEVPPGSEPSGGFPAAPKPPSHHVEAHPTGKRLGLLTLAALGVVFGDIGTSTLYAMKAAFGIAPGYQLPPTQGNVYGVLSMMVWSLVVVVAVKYITFIMKADNRGEGGVLALLALILQERRRDDDKKRRRLLIAVGLFGSALLYGDGMITPAISVLGAMDGVTHPEIGMSPKVVWIASFVILVGVFGVQRFGTAKVGIAFGPIMAIWFITIGALGVREIAIDPTILHAINPWYAVRFFVEHRTGGFIILGAVVLVITGAEALYADMGHFGRRPIRIAWFVLVMPALILNYFGQGALILNVDPSVVASPDFNPFYALAPDGFLLPLIIIAAAAAIIASQALISGAYSLTQQSMALGYSPRMTVVHTSYREAGQIYIPEVNTMLAVGTLLLVVWFQDADELGAAYGIAVTGTMAVTSILFHVVATTRWGWSKRWTTLLTASFLALDFAFLYGNVPKIKDGGYIPIVIAIGVYLLMSTWKRGRSQLTQILNAGSLPIDLFLKDVERRKPPRVSGTAVFMTSSAEGVPLVLLHHLKHNKVLHAQVILVSVLTEGVPEVPDEDRVQVTSYDHGFYRLVARYGFMQQPNIPDVLRAARDSGVKAPANDTTFYLGRERIIIAPKRGPGKSGARRAPVGSSLPALPRWRKKLFAIMTRNARPATEFFGIPPNRVVELGAQVEF
jgi:KUP system potassium uptake protein